MNPINITEIPVVETEPTITKEYEVMEVDMTLLSDKTRQLAVEYAKKVEADDNPDNHTDVDTSRQLERSRRMAHEKYLAALAEDGITVTDRASSTGFALRILRRCFGGDSDD